MVIHTINNKLFVRAKLKLGTCKFLKSTHAFNQKVHNLSIFTLLQNKMIVMQKLCWNFHLCMIIQHSIIVHTIKYIRNNSIFQFNQNWNIVPLNYDVKKWWVHIYCKVRYRQFKPVSTLFTICDQIFANYHYIYVKI